MIISLSQARVFSGSLLRLSIICVCLLCHGTGRAFSGEAKAPSYESMRGCVNHGILVLSAAYSPYSVHLIKAEVSGRIVRVNARDGSILKAGTPIVEIDSRALKDELQQLEAVLASLKKSEKVLARDAELTHRKYQRYEALKAKKHVEAQAVENVEKELHASELALIENRRQQADVKRNIIDLQDRIRKCAPSFSQNFYVAENFKELYEIVVPGENISRLLDISMAKLHLVLSPGCFSMVQKALERQETMAFEIITEDGRSYASRGKVEKLKFDLDNSYLYSYGFDLVFTPVPGLLWGQVVTVRLDLRQGQVGAEPINHSDTAEARS